MSEPTLKPLDENVARRDIEHAKALGVENGKDVSTEKRTWKNYVWDSWDKSPEVSLMSTHWYECLTRRPRNVDYSSR